MGDAERSTASLVDHYRDAEAGAQTSPPHQQEILSGFLRQALGGHRVERALDMGSGRGANLALLSEHAEMVVATDVSEVALVEARQGARDRRVSAVVLPGTGLPFADHSFDLTVCTEVLEHVPDLLATAAELERVTRSDGWLLVSTPNYRNLIGLVKWFRDRRTGREDYDPWHAHEGGLERFMTPARLREAFTGSRVIEQRGADYCTALGIFWPPARRRLNRYLLLRPGTVWPTRSMGMQCYLLMRRLG